MESLYKKYPLVINQICLIQKYTNTCLQSAITYDIHVTKRGSVFESSSQIPWDKKMHWKIQEVAAEYLTP